jgi:hypothetical protein
MLLHKRVSINLKLIVFILKIDLTSSRFFRSYSKYLMARRRQRHARKGESLKIRLKRPWHLELST